MSDADSLLRVRPDDPAYLEQARAEAAYWATAKGLSDFADAPGPDQVQRHVNRRFTGDEQTRWFDTIHTRGDFRRSLVLGAGGITREARILETNPNLHLTVMDISPGALAQRDRQLLPRFPGRVDTAIADFNFLDLPENAYDLIVSSSAVHHVINLEHLAHQVQRALTPDGLFFLDDYVGETKRRFTPEKKAAYAEVYNRELARQGRPPATLIWSDGDDRASPFCCIRSADILPTFAQHLSERERRTSSGLWVPLVFAREANPPAMPLRLRLLGLRPVRPVFRFISHRILKRTGGAWIFDPAFLQDLLDTGDRLADAGAILPSNAFVTYGKR